jgi:hypothetical protein
MYLHNSLEIRLLTRGNVPLTKKQIFVIENSSKFKKNCMYNLKFVTLEEFQNKNTGARQIFLPSYEILKL